MGKLNFMEPVDRYSKIDKNSKLGMYNKLDKDPSKDLIRISSDYKKRTDPFTKEKDVQHGGIDYAVGVSTSVKASERGKVVKAGFNGSDEDQLYGNVIIIDHTPKAADNEPHLYTVYGHLRNKDIEEGPFAANIKTGVEVIKGQLIGYVGKTGNSTGPHLHFAVAHLSKKVEGKG